MTTARAHRDAEVKARHPAREGLQSAAHFAMLRAMSTAANPPTGNHCPQCGSPFDPTRTMQALRRDAKLLFFCSPGCLRGFMAAHPSPPKAEPKAGS